MKRLTLVLSLLALSALPLACGSSDDNSTTAADTTATETSDGGGGAQAGGGATAGKADEVQGISAAADGSLAFDTDTLTTKAGGNEFEFDNPAQIQHDFCIEDSSGNELGCSDLVAQDSSVLTVDLKPGKYTYYCSVPGHREAGMEGTLTVD